ncbi:MAG: DUF5916 domain-containing protein [Gemmatimonadota bacterium]
MPPDALILTLKNSRQTTLTISSFITRCALTAFLLVAAAHALVAQSPRKSTRASRLTGAPPQIDGVLNDAAWAAAPVISDFVQKDPDEGKAPTVVTQVRLLYDNDALYIAARMLRPDARAIRRSISRRDSDSDAEVFTVSLDPYHDRQTGYSFSINSGGVRGDFYHPQDQEGGREAQYDPVWSAHSRVDDQGWSAEMRIPFSQLRFNAGEGQVWGLQLTRNLPDKNERNTWVLIPRDVAGFFSQFGQLDGISGIPTSRRLELLPYVTGGLTYRANANPANPFEQKATGRVGGDLKMGLGPNLTLNATVMPDFGQVEADPADVNLTAFETVFTERRPFFTEGAEALAGLAQNFINRPVYFYSRRIGAPPRGSTSGDFIDQPVNTDILSAAKVTGRLKSGLSVGVLAAVTPMEHARSYDSLADRIDAVAVEPASSFAVVRLQQDFGKQQSNAGINLTHAHHFVDERGGLQDILSRDAFAGGMDFKLRSQQGKYEFTGFVGASYVEGDSTAIARLQRGSAHYFQRPDQDHIRFNPGRTSLSGYTASLRHDKNAGYSFWGIQLIARSPGFEINDLGRMQTADDIDFNADFGVRNARPKKSYRFYSLNWATRAGWNFGGIRQYSNLGLNTSLTFNNFTRASLNFAYNIRSLSDVLTRGGPLMGTPNSYSLSSGFNSRPNIPVTWSVNLAHTDDELGGWSWTARSTFSVRPGARWQASVDPTYTRSADARQYVTTKSGGSAATFGSRYTFAFVDRSQLSARFRLNYAVTPNFTVEAYAEPFAASGKYSKFGELSAPRSRQLRGYGEAGTGTAIVRNSDSSYTVTDGAQSFSLPNLDFNRLSFRSNLVLRWEWLPGSTGYLIWQNNRQTATPYGTLVNAGRLIDALSGGGDNFLALKVSYWIGVK